MLSIVDVSKIKMNGVALVKKLRKKSAKKKKLSMSNMLGLESSLLSSYQMSPKHRKMRVKSSSPIAVNNFNASMTPMPAPIT